jgi:glycosyltransferase involved in cell wall biosynthesis
MRVLLLTQVLPHPPDSGPKVKTWQVIKYLAQRHEVTLASFVRGDQAASVKELQRYCRAVRTVPMSRRVLTDALAMLRSLAGGRPWMMVRDDRAAMRRLVDRLAAETRFDIAHADQLNMAQYAGRVGPARKVLDAHNALWLLYKRLAATMPAGPRKWFLERDWRLLKRYEGAICRDFEAVLAVSDQDQSALQEAAGVPCPVTVIPIAVDTDELVPVARRPDASHVLHLGTMYWPPNIDGVQWFIEQVYPLVRAQRPDVVFDVVGARPPKSLVAFNHTGQNINVAGYVPDPRPYLEQAGVFIVPLRAGGGMRVKILEALARALPVVTTSLGCEGIAVEDGQQVLVADAPAAFAQAVLRVLADRDLAGALGCKGRERVVAQYDYRVACRPLDDVYAGAQGREPRGES